MPLLCATADARAAEGRHEMLFMPPRQACQRRAMALFSAPATRCQIAAPDIPPLRFDAPHRERCLFDAPISFRHRLILCRRYLRYLRLMVTLRRQQMPYACLMRYALRARLMPLYLSRLMFDFIYGAFCHDAYALVCRAAATFAAIAACRLSSARYAFYRHLR